MIEAEGLERGAASAPRFKRRPVARSIRNPSRLTSSIERPLLAREATPRRAATASANLRSAVRYGSANRLVRLVLNPSRYC
jgi:hypothetical protein